MPRTRSVAILLLVSSVLLLAPPAEAAGLANGLAVAVSPDGTRLVAGGDTRALYELDPETLAVKRRVYLGRRVQRMAFSPDGKALIVESTKAVQWLKPDTLEVFKTIEGVGEMSVAQPAGLIAVNDRKPGHVKILSMADGAERAHVPYDRMKSLAGFGLRPDGKKLAVLYGRKRDEKEKTVAYKDIPAELKKTRDARLREFQLRHDGQTSRYQVFDVATGKAEVDTLSWYGQSNLACGVYWHGADVYVVTYPNMNAKFDAKGEATYFELGNSYNYAKGASGDGEAWLTGGLRDGTYTVVAGMKQTTFQLDPLEGFPEYFKAMSFAADGTAYAGTTCYRVARVAKDGQLAKVAAVY